MKSFILDKYTAFVPHPDLRGVWRRVPACVVLVDCPRCGSKRGVPCHDEKLKRYYSTACLSRGEAAEGIKVKIHAIEIDVPDEHIETTLK